MMTMKRSPNRKAIPLFEDARPGAAAQDDVRARLREFAQAVARRHRRSKAGTAEFLTALTGYHRTLTICSNVPVPGLDDALIAFSTAEYRAVRMAGRSAAA
jgi:phosphoglycolate phosphatase-like HAD superfamily hydrolase